MTTSNIRSAPMAAVALSLSKGERIYKIRTDRNERTWVDDDGSRYLNEVGNWIYYDNYSDYYRIYKVRTNGNEH